MSRLFWLFNPEFRNNTCLIDYHNKKVLSYEETDQLVNTVVPYISGEKKLAFLFCNNDYKSIVFYLALLRSGNAVLLLDSKLNNEIRKILINIYHPELIFYQGDMHFDGYDLLSIDQEFSFYHTKNIRNDIHPDLSVLLSTSGTTGSPKLVRLSSKNINANASSISEYLEIQEDQRAITSLPMSYSYGLSVINSHLLTGASLFLTDKSFVFKDFWKIFNEYNCTSFAGVPYTYELLKKTNFENLELPSLKVMTQAGGRLSSDLIKFFSELSQKKDFRFFVMYGQTEATARISYVPSGRIAQKIGSIGIPIPGGEIKIFSEGSEVKEQNIQGELVYTGNNVMMGYAEEREDLAKGDELNKVLYTGDLAYKDEEGYFYITGRLKRFIKIFGLRLNLDDVEKYIESEFEMFNACSGTDDKLNILIDKGDSRIAEAIRLKVSMYYKINKNVITVRIAGKMPVTESGKKDYSAISRLF
jgi:long-chain acyl-CoA synthetase